MSKTWIQLVNKNKKHKNDPSIKENADSYDSAVAVMNFYESTGGKEYYERIKERSKELLFEIVGEANELDHVTLLAKIAKFQAHTELLAEFKFAKIEADGLETIIDELLQKEDED